MLGVPVELAGPPASLAPVAHAYARFVVDAFGPAESAGSIEWRTGSGHGTLRVDRREFRVPDGIDPAFVVYQHFLASVLDRVEHVAVLHAAALATSDGRGVLLAGPSGHGKSSLTLELVSRGLRFLSDDYAPVDLATSNVAPHPRAVALTPRDDATLPEPFRRAVLDPHAPALFGKRLVDVGQVLTEGALGRDPVPVGHVILLSESDPAAPPSDVELAVTCIGEQAVRFHGRLGEIAGIALGSPEASGAVTRIAVRAPAGSRASEDLSRALLDDAVLHVEKLWTERPGFLDVPECFPVRRTDAAAALGREMLNRRVDRGILTRYAGSHALLFLDLAGALASADCRWIRPGPLSATADLVEELLEWR